MQIQPQPDPEPNARQPIADVLINRIMDRKTAGIESYGTPLQAFNGRNPLIDALDEAIDQCKYLLQEIEERRELLEAVDEAIACWFFDEPCFAKVEKFSAIMAKLEVLRQQQKGEFRMAQSPNQPNPP